MLFKNKALSRQLPEVKLLCHSCQLY